MFDLFIYLLGLSIGAAILLTGGYLLISTLRSKDTYMRLNRATLLVALVVFFGMLTLNYSLLNSFLASALALLLIRVSYVIYIDAE